MADIFYAFITAVRVSACFIAAYHFVISLFAWRKTEKKSANNGNVYSFAVIVPAHNEEKVISAALKSIFCVNYDKNYFDVFVIADNCTDNTANIARESGAVVWERNNRLQTGKGHALKWGLNKLYSYGKKYDAVCIADADNIMDRNFLSAVSASFGEGYDSVQGQIETKNPFDSWVTASYYITYLCVNKMYQKARHNIGFPVQLNGTGFAIKTELLKSVEWDESCLTEDIEITAELIKRNIITAYCEDALVYDEKPRGLMTSLRQRTRWMQGQSDAMARYFSQLVRAMKTVNPLKVFDCIIYLLQPLFFVMTGILTIVGIFDAFSFETFSTEKIIADGVLLLIQLCAVPLILLSEGKLNKKTMLYYIPYLIFMYTWIPAAVSGIIKRREKTWFHTEHTVSTIN